MCDCNIFNLIEGTKELEINYQIMFGDYCFLECSECKNTKEYYCRNFIYCSKCHKYYCDQCDARVLDIHLIIEKEVNEIVALITIRKLFSWQGLKSLY